MDELRKPNWFYFGFFFGFRVMRCLINRTLGTSNMKIIAIFILSVQEEKTNLKWYKKGMGLKDS